MPTETEELYVSPRVAVDAASLLVGDFKIGIPLGNLQSLAVSL